MIVHFDVWFKNALRTLLFFNRNLATNFLDMFDAISWQFKSYYTKLTNLFNQLDNFMVTFHELHDTK